MSVEYDFMFGFVAKDQGHSYNVPLWLGEFGTDVQNNYWTFTNKYLKARGIHFADWAFNGSQNKDWKLGTDEHYGMLTTNYRNIRHPWKAYDLIGNHSWTTKNVSEFLQ